MNAFDVSVGKKGRRSWSGYWSRTATDKMKVFDTWGYIRWMREDRACIKWEIGIKWEIEIACSFVQPVRLESRFWKPNKENI